MVDWILAYPFPVWLGLAAIIGGVAKANQVLVKILVKTELLSTGFLKHLEECKAKNDVIDKIDKNQIRLTTTLKHIGEAVKKHDDHLFK